MRVVRIKHYYLDSSDKKYIKLLLKEHNFSSILDFCKKTRISRTHLNDLLASRVRLTKRYAKLLDKYLDTNYSLYTDD